MENETRVNPIVKFAASATPGERKYVLIAGAGVSKDAGVPTAWDVMLETAKLLYCSERDGTPSQEDLEQWFAASQYARMSYADMIGTLYKTYPEQQQFLERLIGTKPIGESHRCIAELAIRGIIRAIITTNFDDCLERALDAAGQTAQVISSDEDLLNSEPLIHCGRKLRIYKPHGTLGRGALRNTPTDLERLSSAMEQELTRVAGEHGLIVLGYSGSDPGMFKVLRERNRNLYPLFWVDPQRPRDEVMQFLEDNGYVYVPCSGAAAFLREYFDLLERLDRIAPSAASSPRLYELEASLKSGDSSTGPLFTEYVSAIRSELARLRPEFKMTPEYDEAILRQIEDSTSAVLRFSDAARIAARYDSPAATNALYQSFSGLWTLCEPPDGTSTGGRMDFDGFKYLWYEMLVIWAAHIINSGNWHLLGNALSEDLLIHENRRSEYLPYGELRIYAQSLDEYRNKRLNLRRLSVTSDLVYVRLTKGPLRKAISAREFLDADYFLYLRSALRVQTADERGRIPLSDAWLPYSCLYLKHTPTYLTRAQGKQFLSRFSAACGSTPEELIKLIGQRCNQYARFFGSRWIDGHFEEEDFRLLGTRS